MAKNKKTENSKKCNNSELENENKDVAINIKDNLDTLEKELDELIESLENENASIEDNTTKLKHIDKHINMFEKTLDVLKFKNEKIKKDTDDKAKSLEKNIEANINNNKRKKPIIIGAVVATVLCFFCLFNIFNKQKQVYPYDTVKQAIIQVETLDKNKIKNYFKDFDADWLKELDFTSNLASSEELKEATNLDELKKIKSELFKILIPKNIKEVITEENDDKVIVSISFNTVNIEEVTKNIVSGLLTASIENSKDGLTVDDIVNGYIDSFTNVTKSNYNTIEGNASIELEKTNDGYVIKDFRKFINAIIPDGNFYKDYMNTVTKQTEETNVSEENKDKKTVIDSVKEAEK